MLPTYRSARATRTVALAVSSLSSILLPLGGVALLTTASAPAVWAQHADTEMQNEHDALLNLVPVGEASHTAVANGNWSAPSTWSAGTVPGVGARVNIPAGRTVTYDVNSTNAVRWVRVTGKLAFARSVTTALTVDTVVIDVGGEWEQGVAGSPIASNVTSTITFSDTGAIDTAGYDPYFQSRGLLSHGKVRICGATVTPFIKANGALAAGATSLTLQATPTNWKANDKIVITGMAMKDVRDPATGFFIPTSTDELKTVSTVSGTSVTFTSGLVDRRVVEYGSLGFYPYVVNHTRNVVFRSANTTDSTRKGHVMFMHNRDVDIRYAAFNDLGRTRKNIDVTNTATQAFPPGSNPRARYAMHFHRTGKDDATVTPSYVQGCSMLNPTSWGYVNHDSFVVFEDNVCHNAFGAAFITENGAEIGTFRRNLASTTPGRGFIKDGVSTHDLARSGTAFWFQGSNLTVENNVATGSSHGYSYFQRSGVNLGESQKVYKNTLIDQDAAGGNDFVFSADTPMMRFKGNVAIGNYEGMFNVDNEINGIWPTNSVVEDFFVLNSKGQASIRVEYYRNFTFKNVKVIRDSTMPPDAQYHGTYGINANHLVDHLYPWETRSTDRHDGVYIRGHWNGIDNDDGTLGVDQGSPERIAKHDVIDNSIDFVGPGHVFPNTGTLLGQPLVRYIARADAMTFPTFTPAAGRYATAQTVTITAPAGTTIYYVVGTSGYANPSVESRIKPGTWTAYTGPVTISSTQKLIAVAVRNGIYTRIRNGVYTIDPNAVQQVATPTFNPGGGTYTSAQSVAISTATSGATIRYTTNGTNPTATSGTVYSGPVSVATSLTLKAIAYKSGMSDSSVATANYTIDTGTGNPTGTGSITRDVWNNITGTAVSAIPVATAPSTTGTITSLEGPTNIADNYGARIRGYITAPTTGSYTFWIAGDDDCELYLSTNDQPSSKIKIASVVGWTNSREWNKYASQKSTARTLTAGQRYYVEVLHKEGSGGDNVAVGWMKPGGSGTVPSEVVPGIQLSPWVGTTPTTVTLNPTEDRNTQNDSTGGTNPIIACSRYNTIYLKFDLASVTGTLTSAKLRIYKASATSGMGATVSQIASDSWTQATAPASLPAVGAAITSSSTPDAAGYIEIDITAYVQSQVNGDKILSVALNTSLDTWTDFHSKEGVNKPQLVITK